MAVGGGDLIDCYILKLHAISIYVLHHAAHNKHLGSPPRAYHEASASSWAIEILVQKMAIALPSVRVFLSRASAAQTGARPHLLRSEMVLVAIWSDQTQH